MNRDQALSKIKKCLALAKSANPHEASAAMRQAQKLMAEHGLDQAAVDLADIREERVRAAMDSMPRWEVRLADIVGEAFGCNVIWTKARRLVGSYRVVTDTIVVFIGSQSGAQVGRYAYEVLSRQCARSRLAHIRVQPRTCKPITRTARGDAFADGWVSGVRELVEKFANSDANQLLIEQYVKLHFPDIKTTDAKNRAVGRNVRDTDHWKGVEAGRNAQLNRGVGGMTQQERLA